MHLRYTFPLLVALCLIQIPDVIAQQTAIKDQVASTLGSLQPNRSLTDLPENYTDYGFVWNAGTASWDSSDITTVEYWMTSNKVNVRSETQDFEGNVLVPGDWFEVHNLNMEASDPLDPKEAYTYYPADSIHSVIDAPFFGIFPLSLYFEATAEGRLSSEDSYLNGALIGEPGNACWLGKSVTHYDQDGQLSGYNVDYDGLDSTTFTLDAEGKLVRSVNMYAFEGTEPEEYTTHDYGYDKEGRLIFDLTTYYSDSLQSIDFQDSLAYIYGAGDNYEREAYSYDIASGTYDLNGIVEYIFEDTSDYVNLYSVSNGEATIWQSTRTDYDDVGRVKRILFQQGPSGNLMNSQLIIRVYEGPVSAVHEITEASNWITAYYDGSSVKVHFDSQTEGEIRMFTANGQLVERMECDGITAVLNPPDLPAGIYFITVTDAQGHLFGSTRCLIY